MTEEDSVFRDKGLNPETDYNYRAYLLNNNVKTDSSNLLQTNTMDTTTHNFTWTTYNIGYISSVLYDVFALSNNDVWAVGEIYSDSGEYNAVHWDGNTWQLVNIEAEYLGNLGSPPMFGIYGFSNNDIWANPSVPWHWDGNEWIQYHLWDMGILDPNDGGVSHMWGTSSSNIYFAGEKGTLVHYDGSNWIKLNGGTDLTISDIWGFQDDYLVANAGSSSPLEVYLLIYKDGILERSISNPYLTGDLWGTSLDNIYVVGNAILHFDGDSLHTLDWPSGIPVQTIHDIRGSSDNNVFMVGTNGLVAHFNGSSWFYYPELMQGRTQRAVAVIDNEVFSVGSGGLINHGKK